MLQRRPGRNYSHRVFTWFCFHYEEDDIDHGSEKQSCSETSVSEQLPLKTAKYAVFCRTCSTTNRVVEQVQYPTLLILTMLLVKEIDPVRIMPGPNRVVEIDAVSS